VPEAIIPTAVYFTNEAARLLRIQPSTLLFWVRTGRIHGEGKPYRFVGRELLRAMGGHHDHAL